MTKILTEQWINQWKSLDKSAKTNKVWLTIINQSLSEYFKKLEIGSEIKLDKSKLTNQVNIHLDDVWYQLLGVVANPHVLLSFELDFIFKNKVLERKEYNHLNNTLRMYLEDYSDLESIKFNINDLIEQQIRDLKETFKWIKEKTNEYDLKNHMYVIKDDILVDLFDKGFDVLIENVKQVDKNILNNNQKEILINDFSNLKNDINLHMNPKTIVFDNNKPIKPNNYVIKGR